MRIFGRIRGIWALCFGSLVVTVVANASYDNSMLYEIQGIGLELRQPNVKSENLVLSQQELEDHIGKTLGELGVRLMSDIELEVMRGHPFLEVSIDVAHAQGPSHIFVVRLDLREMARLERPKDSVVEMAVSTWERKILGIANRPEAIYDVLDKLLRIFADELRAANMKPAMLEG